MTRTATMLAVLAVLSTPTARHTAHAQAAGSPVVVGAAIDIPGVYFTDAGLTSQQAEQLTKRPRARH